MFKAETNNWTVRGELLISFFPAGAMDSELWLDFCDTISTAQVTKLLAATLGPTELSADQRRCFNQALTTRPATSAAVLTDEALVRGMMMATGWIERVDLRVFAWHKLGDAVEFLEPESITQTELTRIVEALRQQVRGPRP